MKKLLSVILVFCILFSSFSIFANAGSEKYISDIIFTEDKNDTSYTYLDFDINTGTMSDYSIYLGYKRTSIVSEAIRSIKFYIIGMDYDGWNNGFAFPPTIPETIDSYGCQYNRVCWQDLNHGCWGDYIYAYCSKDYSAGAPITDILLDTKINDGYNTAYSFDGIIANLKSNALKIPTSLKGQRPYDFDSAPKVDISIYLQWISDGSISGKMFPAGYDFYEDSYHFVNDQSVNISKKYYTTIFEPGTAELVYDETHNAGGLCYGFAYTTAAIYNGLPDVSRFSYLDGLEVKIATKIRDLDRKTFFSQGSSVIVGGSYDDCLTLSDYIKYAFIYQYSQEALDILYSSADDTLGLFNTVKEFTHNNNIGVVVGFSKRKTAPSSAPCGHEVLAVGYDGNDILIDDPNNSSDFERMTVNADGSWRFGSYNSTDHVLDYAINIHRPYQILLTGTKITPSSIFSKTNAVAKDEYYIDGMERLDSEYTLVSINSSAFNMNSIDCLEFPTDHKDGYEAEEPSTGNKLYWIRDTKTIKISDLSDETNIIKYAGDDTVISTTVEKDSDVTITIDEEINNAAISTSDGKEASISISTVDEDGNKMSANISGTASSDTVTATQTETGLVVTGISDGTVTLSKDDEVIETQEISNATSDIEITYDKTGENDDVSLDYEHSHTDSDADGKCDICGETLDAVKNCTHLCHKTGFLGFIWKIVNIFNKLFEINPVCSCGMKHY